MRSQNTSKKASDPIEIEFTDKPMTPYGGLVVLARFFDKLHLRTLLASVLPDQRTSPNALPVVEIGGCSFGRRSCRGNPFCSCRPVEWGTWRCRRFCS